jgi:hypothetical protein
MISGSIVAATPLCFLGRVYPPKCSSACAKTKRRLPGEVGLRLPAGSSEDEVSCRDLAA